MTVDADILIVIATVVTIFAASSSLAGWVNRTRPVMALISLAIGLGLLGYVHLFMRPEGLVPRDIPDAFIHVAAMVLN